MIEVVIKEVSKTLSEFERRIGMIPIGVNQDPIDTNGILRLELLAVRVFGVEYDDFDAFVKKASESILESVSKVKNTDVSAFQRKPADGIERVALLTIASILFAEEHRK